MKSALALTLLAALASAAALAEGPAAKAPARVRAAAAGSQGSVRTVAATVVAARKATIATRVGATVKAVSAEEGERVSQGQLLVTLADEDLQAQRRSALAAREAALSHHKRISALAAQRAATAAELEQAQLGLAQAEAAVKAAEAQLDYTRIRAPFAAVVQARRVSAGDLVGPGAPLYELDGGGLELQASLSEDEARGLRLGQTLAFESEGTRGEAAISALVPGGDPVSHRSGLKARIKAPPATLRTGAFARLLLPGAGEQGALWIPRSALVQRGDLTGVFVLEGGVASLRWLSIGEEQPERVRVRAGLRPSEKFALDGTGLVDGQAVEVQP
jgi:membrane fusion protein, multidrug efflux system